MARPPTIYSIQLLRSVAACLVVMFHTHQVFAARATTALFRSEAYLFGFGAVGVHVFFVISGLIMVVTSQAKGQYDPRTFYRRRFMRIYPIYWVCAAGYLAIHWLIGQPYTLSGGELLRALTLLPADGARIIGPAWTLSFEMYFYICFGLAMMASLTRGLALLGTAFALAIAVGAVVHPHSDLAWLVTNTLLLEFLGGAAIGWLLVKGRLPRRAGPAITIVGIALFCGGIAFGYQRLPSAVSWGVPSAVLVLGLVSWEGLSGAAPAVRRLGKLGDSSYVLYLIHILVIDIIAFATFGRNRFEPTVTAALITLVCVALAVAIHNWVERPLLALINAGVRPAPARRPSPERESL